MAAKTQEALTSLIDRMVEEKVFGLEALQAIQNLKERAKLLEEQVNLINVQKESVEAAYKQAKADRDEARAEVTRWVNRELGLEAREKTITDLEKRLAVAEARSAAQNETVAMFLKLPSVRRNITETIGHVVPPSATQAYPTIYQSQDRTETVETNE